MVRRVDGAQDRICPCFCFRAFRSATRWRADAGRSGGTHGSRPTAPGSGRIWNPPLRLKEKANSNRQGSAQRSGRRGKRRRSNPTTTPIHRRTVHAAPGFFDCRGKAQGRRGHRHPPDRFARPPYLRTGGTPVRLKRFLFHRSGGDFSLARQRKVGAGILREPPGPLSRRAAAQIRPSAPGAGKPE